MAAQERTAWQYSLSGHIEDHWVDRSPRGSVSIEQAWESGQRIEPSGVVRNFDELRLHHDTRTLLGREGISLTTVYDIDDFEHGGEYYRAISHAVEDFE